MELIKDISARTARLLENGFYKDEGVRKTELVHAPLLSKATGLNIWFKCENLQRTGSFKLRGATSALLNLSHERVEDGVLVASSGNHGAACALAGSLLDIAVTVYVPESIAPGKEAKIKAAGATIVKVPGPSDRAELAAAKEATKSGKPYISPYNHPDTIAGQGTIADEIISDLPEVDMIVASVGGGGLICGISARMQDLKQGVHMLACSPSQSPAFMESLKAGKVVDLPDLPTLSDGTAGGLDDDSITMPLGKALISEMVSVTEIEIAHTMKLIFQETGMVVEGAAAVALGGLLECMDDHQGKTAVIILCGGNVTNERFQEAIEMTHD